MKKYQHGHSMYPFGLIVALAFTVILTLAAIGLGVASIWVEPIRTAAAWVGVICGVFWVYVGYNLLDEGVKDLLRDISP